MKRYFVGNEDTIHGVQFNRYCIAYFIDYEGIKVAGSVYGNTKDECYANACAIVLFLNTHS